MWKKSQIPKDILKEITDTFFIRDGYEDTPDVIKTKILNPSKFDNLIDVYKQDYLKKGNNILLWDNPEFEWLKNEIYNFVKESYPQVEENSKCISWFNNFKKTGSQRWHNHIFAEIQDPKGNRIFQYYLKKNSKTSKSIPISGHILFETPKETPTWTEFYDPGMGRFKIDSCKGRIIIFDSKILHKARNISNLKYDEIRMGIAFDIIPPDYKIMSRPISDVWDMIKNNDTNMNHTEFMYSLSKLPNHFPRNDYTLFKNLNKKLDTNI